ncbi:MAG: hypothetical protein ACREBO_05785 [Novosphingobium sp.]
MDLNELLFRHQVALIRAGQAAASRCNPVAHYAGLLRELRARLGVATYAGARA